MREKVCKCGEWVERGKRCPVCGPPPTVRHYNSKWDQLSRGYRKRHPLCEKCNAKGITRKADEVHHVVHLKDCPERMLDATNLVALCRVCHREEHEVRDTAEPGAADSRRAGF